MAQAETEPSITVRPARLEDVPAILEIYNHAVLHTTATADYDIQALEQRKQWYHSRIGTGFPVFVAADSEGEILGWSSYGPYHTRFGYRFTVENSVYVSHLHRRKGAGRKLLAALIEHARGNNIHAIVASIDAANEPSIRLHAAYGFERVALMKEIIYKFDRWLDIVYMELLIA